MAGVFAIQIDIDRTTHAGFAFAPVDRDDPVDVVVHGNRFPSGRADLIPGRLRPQAGKAVVTWTYNGQKLFATGTDGRNPVAVPDYEVAGTTTSELVEDIKAREESWRARQMAFKFPKPDNLGPSHPTVDAVAVGRINWIPEDKNIIPCFVERTFNMHWVHRPPLEELKTRPAPALNPRQGSLERPPHAPNTPEVWLTRNGNVMIASFPWYLYWGVTSTKKCCGTSLPYRVIQFARASLYSRDPRFQKGKVWSLDVVEDQRVKANEATDYDPTFTTSPGDGVQTRVFETGKPGNRSLAQFDAPGMTEVLYDQLTAAQGHHEFKQQFFTLLVCAPGLPKSNVASSYLDRATVARAVVFTITWTFDNPNRDGTPIAPVIVPHIESTVEMGCRANLAAVLAANGLTNAFARPGPSRLEALSDADASAHATALGTPPTVQVPAP